MKRLVCGAGMALVLGLMAGNTMAFQAYQLYHNTVSYTHLTLPTIYSV